MGVQLLQRKEHPMRCSACFGGPTSFHVGNVAAKRWAVLLKPWSLLLAATYQQHSDCLAVAISNRSSMEADCNSVLQALEGVQHGEGTERLAAAAARAAAALKNKGPSVLETKAIMTAAAQIWVREGGLSIWKRSASARVALVCYLLNNFCRMPL